MRFYMDNRAIGIFDSGVGGLTVVKEVFGAMPGEEIVYFGDTARVPYGSKSRETVLKFSVKMMDFLLSQDVKAVIIACHTISSNCYDDLKNMYDIPVAEVVTPGAAECAASGGERIGVIGTELTIKSGAFERHIKAINPDAAVYSKACPLFVPLAEEGWTDGDVTERVAEIYLREFAERHIDTLLIGCTHYPLLINSIAKVLSGVRIINPAEAVARKMRAYLAENNMLRGNERPPDHRFYISDDTEKFDLVSRLALKRQYRAVKVDLGE